MDAETVIGILGLRPHPEGGHYAETWRGEPGADGRGVGTAIHYLLRAGESSVWHRVDATEIWLFHAGAPLELRTAPASGTEAASSHILGADLAAGQRPQVVLAPGEWQSARCLGGWTLVSCTVSPAFRFEGFDLAPPGWEPGASAASGGG
jgi:predicted cupin superfamily sugar epimerase